MEEVKIKGNEKEKKEIAENTLRVGTCTKH